MPCAPDDYFCDKLYNWYILRIGEKIYRSLTLNDMTTRSSKLTVSRLLALILTAVLAFALASCGEEEPEPEPVIQVPYFIGTVLRSSDSEHDEEYRTAVTEAFAALETESARYELSFMYSEDDQLQQEHHVSYFIAQGVDAVFVQPVSYESCPAVHDLIIDSGGTYGVFLDGDPGEGSLDGDYIFCYTGDSGITAEVKTAAEKINELLIPAPEPEEGEGEETASAG